MQSTFNEYLYEITHTAHKVKMKLSKFGEKFTQRSGITSLMEDLSHGLTSGESIMMMGGGNPSHIPEVQSIFRERLTKIINNPDDFKNLIGIYDSPKGDPVFISALANLLKQRCGWPISQKNIAIVNGSQSAFFILFNMFAGACSDGTEKKILFPLCPEYIGYSDIGLSKNFFTANKPLLEYCDENQFKYHIDFNRLKVDDHIGAMCLSRPTNPSGNVVTDQEIEQLQRLAKQNAIPLIIDSAYGTPFPDIIFVPATPTWDSNTIVSMSLSKLGLPTARTGIIIAAEEIIEIITEANAVLSLSTGSFGTMLAQDIVETGQIIELSQTIIKPYYYDKAKKALAFVKKSFATIPYKLHKPEGAMFLWFWFEGLPISSQELYERLKARGVYVIAGHHFFPGLNEAWQHAKECIRVTYTQDEAVIEGGLAIIAEEVRRAFEEG